MVHEVTVECYCERGVYEYLLKLNIEYKAPNLCDLYKGQFRDYTKYCKPEFHGWLVFIVEHAHYNRLSVVILSKGLFCLGLFFPG